MAFGSRVVSSLFIITKLYEMSLKYNAVIKLESNDNFMFTTKLPSINFIPHKIECMGDYLDKTDQHFEIYGPIVNSNSNDLNRCIKQSITNGTNCVNRDDTENYLIVLYGSGRVFHSAPFQVLASPYQTKFGPFICKEIIKSTFYSVSQKGVSSSGTNACWVVKDNIDIRYFLDSDKGVIAIEMNALKELCSLEEDKTSCLSRTSTDSDKNTVKEFKTVEKLIKTCDDYLEIKDKETLGSSPIKYQPFQETLNPIGTFLGPMYSDNKDQELDLVKSKIKYKGDKDDLDKFHQVLLGRNSTSIQMVAFKEEYCTKGLHYFFRHLGEIIILIIILIFLCITNFHIWTPNVARKMNIINLVIVVLSSLFLIIDSIICYPIGHLSFYSNSVN